MKGLESSTFESLGGSLAVQQERVRRRQQARTIFAVVSTVLLTVALFHTACFKSIIPFYSRVVDGSHSVVKQSPDAPLHPSPTVVLDYCTVVPHEKKENPGILKYQNIRYAAVPTGPLRWEKPQWPPVEEEINVGDLAEHNVTCTYEEDCLYMDIYVPANPTKKKLPILTFTYGSGFYCCSKTDDDPQGFFELSNDFIYISFNHRIGIGGLANAPTFVHEGGTPNVMLWDVEHGYKWIQKYIHLFGGDKDQVTVFGYSAGSAILLSMMTRFSGRNEQLFSKAYIVSPGYTPSAGHGRAEQYWQNLSTSVGCPGGSIECMRTIPWKILQDTSIDISNEYSYVMEPRVDGNFVGDALDYQFYRGNFNWTGPLVITNGIQEVGRGPYPGVNTTEDLVNMLRTWFPGMSDAFIEEAMKLYPEEDYKGPGYRFAEMRQTWDLTGHTFALTQALKNQTWNGIDYLSLGEHGADQAFYWYPTYVYDDCKDMFKNLTSTSSATAAQKSLWHRYSNNIDVEADGTVGATYSHHFPAAEEKRYDLADICFHPYTDPFGNPTPTQPVPVQGGGLGPGKSLGGVMGPIPTRVNVLTARSLQKYLLSLVITGDPNTMWADEKVYWPKYNTTNPGTVLIINDTFHSGQFDEWDNEKSWFWSKALWY